MKPKILLPLLACAAIALSGCSSTPSSRYAWNNYGTHLYDYEAQQIDNAQMLEFLQQAVEESKTRSVKLAPGLYAEIGTILIRMGRPAEAVQYYKLEAETWPESAPFMNALASNVSKLTTGNKESTK
jgi:hypothetical protein